MDKIFTVKPVISNKAVLASVLAFIELFGDDPNTSIDKDIFHKILGTTFLEKMQLLENKAYFVEAIDSLKNSSFLTDIARKFKENISIGPFMKNVSESISKEYVTFTDGGIVEGDYVFVLSAEFCLAQFIAAKKVLADSNLELKKEVELLFSDFKHNVKHAQNQFDTLKKIGQFDEYTIFSSNIMDQFLREQIKNYKLESLIKALVDGGYGEFVVLQHV